MFTELNISPVRRACGYLEGWPPGFPAKRNHACSRLVLRLARDLRGGMDQFVAEGYAQKLCIRYASGPGNHFVRPETTDDACGTTMAKGKILKNTGGTCGCYEELMTK